MIKFDIVVEMQMFACFVERQSVDNSLDPVRRQSGSYHAY